jgi:DNA-directed RNA polymerase subunit RPC12/RpoP
MSKKPKKQVVCEIDCPHCSEKIIVLREVEILSPAVPAEKQERFYAEKSTQTTLT